MTQQQQHVYLVGIDPQISLLAIDIKNHATKARVKWYQVLLKRKDSFQKAEDWQSYVIQQCIRTVNDVEAIILNNLKKHSVMNQQPSYKVYFAVEQQRGRVKTIPETCLVTAARMKGWIIRIPHPRTWKKAIDFNEMKSKPVTPGNKANKARAQELYEKELRMYCSSENPPLLVPKVIHHLCDAACIVAFLQTTLEDAKSNL